MLIYVFVNPHGISSETPRDPGSARELQEAPGGPRRAEEALGGPRALPDGPRTARRGPGDTHGYDPEFEYRDPDFEHVLFLFVSSLSVGLALFVFWRQPNVDVHVQR